MLNLYFLPVAQSEIEAARQWYDDQLPDLGTRFLIAVDGVLARIQENPQQFPVVRAVSRRAIINGFPYALYFKVSGGNVYVTGCVHMRRHPRRWRR
ncbi:MULTISPECIES: type II toxin-antitoxin system RelE/ParE family toxin [Nitrospirillum]|uniref:type II toxin-antitoxin system RelE/ParE family toxin n=1 Tax=Nitrospirillum amazonense TaxID=28077 RepID=UPI0011A8C51C|nr:type II toxin-antitoxin system RelE/ParE family toxin [Nitrospirillum amazonense]MEC4592395.1 hypothetical protein [Nitrospirillum amazonense]